MTQTLVDLLTEIREDLRAMEVVRRVYETVPESIGEFPAVIVAAMGGRCWVSSHGRESGATPLMCQHDVRVEVHIPRKNLENDAFTMTDLADRITQHLYSGFVRDRYNGTMVTTGDPRTTDSAGTLDYTVGPSLWAGQQTYAMICDFQVTTEREVIP